MTATGRTCRALSPGGGDCLTGGPSTPARRPSGSASHGAPPVSCRVPAALGPCMPAPRGRACGEACPPGPCSCGPVLSRKTYSWLALYTLASRDFPVGGYRGRCQRCATGISAYTCKQSAKKTKRCPADTML